MSETDRSGARPRRPLAGLVVGIAALLVLGYPILVTALLLAVPVASGLAVARVRSRAAWLSGGVLIVAVVLAWALLSALG